MTHFIWFDCLRRVVAWLSPVLIVQSYLGPFSWESVA
jgi:hypothetical protein